jgi:hypothetical protein
MQGMTMEFAVQNAKLLEGLKAGDQVHGRLKVESGKYIIKNTDDGALPRMPITGRPRSKGENP